MDRGQVRQITTLATSTLLQANVIYRLLSGMLSGPECACAQLITFSPPRLSSAIYINGNVPIEVLTQYLQIYEWAASH